MSQEEIIRLNDNLNLLLSGDYHAFMAREGVSAMLEVLQLYRDAGYTHRCKQICQAIDSFIVETVNLEQLWI